jgi:hypothetical protein
MARIARYPAPAGDFSVVAAGSAKNISVFAHPGLAFVETVVALFDSEIAAASLDSRVVADVDASFEPEAAAAAVVVVVVVVPVAFVIASFALPSARKDNMLEANRNQKECPDHIIMITK